MMEVHACWVSNKTIYAEFCIDPIEEVLASRQLQWLGKIALMDKSHLPRKFLAPWHRNPHSLGSRQTTICHSYIHALHMIGAISEDDKAGKLSDWFPQILDDPKAWKILHKLLMPNKLGRKDCNELFGE
eukprot:10868564-Ditylum_brightwellii.AAC.1